MNDIESDFWKEIFVHMQHKNMMRINAEHLYLSDCDEQFNRFQYAHPEIQVEITNAETYKTWEFFVTSTVKLRLYIQNQIKASLLQRDKSGFTKICDAKFINNPFPEIEELLKNKDSYEVKLEREKNEALRNQKKLQLTEQFIKALLVQKFKNDRDIEYKLTPNQTNFTLTITKNNNMEVHLLGMDNFQQVISSL